MQKEIRYNMFQEIYICEILIFIDSEDICQTNSRKNAQKVEKYPQAAITIDEVKCRKKLDTICLQKSTFVRYYFSSILKMYVRQMSSS